MTSIRVAYLLTSCATAGAAFRASWWWYLSSKPSPQATELPQASIDDNPAAYIMGAQVDIYSIQDALEQASLLNKRAAVWSAVAAFLGGVAAFLGIF